MQTVHLRDEFKSPDTERAVLAALSRNPALYWELRDTLTAEAFDAEPEAWAALSADVEGERRPRIPEGWEPSPNPADSARHLADLLRWRQLADLQERISRGLFNREPPQELAARLEESAADVQALFRDSGAARLEWGSDFLPSVLRDAEDRNLQRQQTGRPVMGLRTGIGKYDEVLNGLEPKKLHILAGAPGIGKTTFCHYLAAQITREAPVVYVTFENSKENLTLKALAARAGIDTKRIRRGEADLSKLREAAAEWEPFARRIAYIEGSPSLSVDQLRAKVKAAMNHHRADNCLVVVDYLQLWAKSAAHLRHLPTIRERVESMASDLRAELAVRLNVPVLAICSVSRGENGKGYEKPTLANLKEAGDLEFDGDTISFLQKSEQGALRPARALTLKVEKNRDGDGEPGIEVIFRADVGVIRERGASDR